MSMIEYVTKFKRFWDQLLNYEPFPECSCGAMEVLSASHDKAYVMRFLMALNENFKTLRSQILMPNPFPSVSKVMHGFFNRNHTKALDIEVLAHLNPNAAAMYAN